MFEKHNEIAGTKVLRDMNCFLWHSFAATGLFKKTQTMPGVARGKPEGPTGPTATAYNYAEVLADGARAPRWKKNQGYKMQMAW